jgi:hypothetical protein
MTINCTSKALFVPPKTTESVCPSGHNLACINGNIYAGGKKHCCKLCNNIDFKVVKHFWNCYVCEYDLCVVKMFSKNVLIKKERDYPEFDKKRKLFTCHFNHPLV